MGFVAYKALLEIEGAKAEILSASYSFSQAIDGRKGQGISRVKNGLIKLTIHSGAVEMKGKILSWMNAQNSSSPTPAEAVINFYHETGDVNRDKVPFKSITFKNGIIVAYEESFNSAGANNALEHFSVSAPDINIYYEDGGIDLDFRMHWSN